MAKKKKSMDSQICSPMMDQDYQIRDDVDRLMRADEVRSDSSRFKAASSRIKRLANRLGSRNGGRSGGR